MAMPPAGNQGGGDTAGLPQAPLPSPCPLGAGAAPTPHQLAADPTNLTTSQLQNELTSLRDRIAATTRQAFNEAQVHYEEETTLQNKINNQNLTNVRTRMGHEEARRHKRRVAELEQERDALMTETSNLLGEKTALQSAVATSKQETGQVQRKYSAQLVQLAAANAAHQITSARYEALKANCARSATALNPTPVAAADTGPQAAVRTTASSLPPHTDTVEGAPQRPSTPLTGPAPQQHPVLVQTPRPAISPSKTWAEVPEPIGVPAIRQRQQSAVLVSTCVVVACPRRASVDAVASPSSLNAAAPEGGRDVDEWARGVKRGLPVAEQPSPPSRSPKVRRGGH